MKIDDLEHINLRSEMYVDSVVPRPQRTWVATITEPARPELPAGSITAADKKRLEKLLEAEKEGADSKAADKLLAKYGADREGVDALLAQEGVKPAAAPAAAVSVERREVTYVPALLKIFDEVLTNATDQSKLDESLRTIKVWVKDGLITVRNDGVGLPIGKRMAGSDQELITDLFGSLRSSANYDAAQARVGGGLNGLGVKLANIFSTEFSVTVVDPSSGQQFEQRWTDGMKQRGEARITKTSLKKGFVQVAFRPRPSFLEPHGTLEGDLPALFAKRTLDACACTPPNVAVYWNDIQLPLKKFEHFVETYVGKDTFKVFCHTDNWKVGVAFAEGSDQVSFCNGIATLDGGTHVEHVQNAITSALSRKAAATRGSKELSEAHIRNHMWLFVEANIENPTFNSQSKLRLTTPISKFAPKRWVPDKEALESFVNKIYGSDIVKSARVLADAAEVAKLARVGGKKTATLKQMPKGLEDAHRAGTKDAGKCSLILTEGESAKGFAMAGLKVIGRDYFGVYPLKGKPLNVKDCDVKKQLANKELTDIFQILGLTPGKKYKDSSELRYGSILVLSDQDHDGAHIRGLVLNIIHEHAKTEAGTTLLHDGYVRTLRTPLLKAFKGNQIRIFYDYHSAEAFTRSEGSSGWNVKYFKGLGSSTPDEARECFEEMRENLLRYVGDASTNDKMTLAFGAKREDDRKDWIEARIREVAANPVGVSAAVKTKTRAATKAKGGPSKLPPPPDPAESVLVNRFIDTELADFSVADVMRTLPQLMDGLKTTQRKVMYVCLKDKLVGERKRQKVFILSSSVAAKTNYHHGNVSMENTIVRLAQNFVGANNVPLLFPDGQFGCLDPNTEVLRWDGSLTCARDVKVGNILVGDDGTPRHVLRTTSGTDSMYKITMKNGESYVINSEHILTLQHNMDSRIYWKESNKSWWTQFLDTSTMKMVYKSCRTGESTSGQHFNKSTLTKEEAYEALRAFLAQRTADPIIDIKVADYMALPISVREKLYCVKNSSTIQWEHAPTPIDPYVFGCWLGDGNANGTGITSPDVEVLKAFALYCDTISCEMTHDPNCKNKDGTIHENYHFTIRKQGSSIKTSIGDADHNPDTCIGCQTSGKKHVICTFRFDKTPARLEDFVGGASSGMKRTDMNPWKMLLKKHNLFNNKHIPKMFLFNDENTRLQVLAGLLDTDGTLKYISGVPFYELSQSMDHHRSIIEGARIIAGSLGYVAKLSVRTSTTCTGKRIQMGTLRISGHHLDRIPIRIPRKKVADTKERRRNPYTQSFEIKELGPGTFCGWQVDGNERFLLGDFTITHNSRLQGGKDAAASRYIFTFVDEPVTRIFHPEDAHILNIKTEDGDEVEPDTMFPVVPLLLVNGSKGIATGFSTTVLPHRMRDVTAAIRAIMDGRPVPELTPHWAGFKGTVEKAGNAWITKGLWRVTGDTVEVNELPVGRWTEDYCEMLKDMKAKGTIRDFKNNSFDDSAAFTVRFPTEDALNALVEKGELEKELKLSNRFSAANMHVRVGPRGINKYADTEQLLRAWYDMRLEVYGRRKESMLRRMQDRMAALSAKAKFIETKIREPARFDGKRKAEFEAECERAAVPRLEGGYEFAFAVTQRELTFEKVEAMRAELRSLGSEIKQLETTSLETMWRADLDEVEKVLC